MHLTIFDLDHTLLLVNGSFRYYFFLVKNKKLSYVSVILVTFYYLRYRFFSLSTDALHHKIFQKFLKDKKADTIIDLAEEFWKIYFTRYCNKKVVACLNRAKQKKHHVLILSSSPAFLVQPIATRLQVDYQGASYVLDKENRFIKLQQLMNGKNKAQAAQALAKKLNLAKDKITAYSDSYLDLELLELAQKAIVVNPSYKLKKIAKKRGWKIL